MPSRRQALSPGSRGHGGFSSALLGPVSQHCLHHATCPVVVVRSDTAIGDRVGALVPEGATLQLGIGAVPDAVLSALAGRRGLIVWSEMFSDGVLALERAGALAGQIIGQVAHPSVREELRQAARELGFAGDWSREGNAFSPGDR